MLKNGVHTIIFGAVCKIYTGSIYAQNSQKLINLHTWRLGLYTHGKINEQLLRYTQHTMLYYIAN